VARPLGFICTSRRFSGRSRTPCVGRRHQARRAAQLPSFATTFSRTLRHSNVQECSASDVSTTMIYVHVLNRGGLASGVRSTGCDAERWVSASGCGQRGTVPHLFHLQPIHVTYCRVCPLGRLQASLATGRSESQDCSHHGESAVSDGHASVSFSATSTRTSTKVIPALASMVVRERRAACIRLARTDSHPGVAHFSASSFFSVGRDSARSHTRPAPGLSSRRRDARRLDFRGLSSKTAGTVARDAASTAWRSTQ